MRKKVTETRTYRIDSACYSQCQSLLYFDHYYFRSLLLLRSILFYIVTELYHPIIQYRIGLISEVIVIGSNSDQSIIVIGIVNSMHCQSYMLLFQSLFFAILSSHFCPKRFCACFHFLFFNIFKNTLSFTLYFHGNHCIIMFCNQQTVIIMKCYSSM